MWHHVAYFQLLGNVMKLSPLSASHLLGQFLGMWYQGHGWGLLRCQGRSLRDPCLDVLIQQGVAVALLGKKHREAVFCCFTSCCHCARVCGSGNAVIILDGDMRRLQSTNLFKIMRTGFMKPPAIPRLAPQRCRIPALQGRAGHQIDPHHIPRHAVRYVPPTALHIPVESCKMRHRPVRPGEAKNFWQVLKIPPIASPQSVMQICTESSTIYIYKYKYVSNLVWYLN